MRFTVPFWYNQVEPLPGNLLLRIAEYLSGPGIPMCDPTRLIYCDDNIFRSLGNGAKEMLAFLAFIRCRSVFGDVSHVSENAAYASELDDLRRNHTHKDFPGLTAQFEFEVLDTARHLYQIHHPDSSLFIRPEAQFHSGAADYFTTTVTRHAFEAVVHVYKTPLVQCRNRNRIRNNPKNPLKQLFAFLQYLIVIAANLCFV